MLQDRHSKPKPTLQPLRSMMLKPTSCSVHRNALHQLKEICSVQVSFSGRQHKEHYVVEVFADFPRGELATTTSSSVSAAENTDTESPGVQATLSWRPVARVKRDLQAFVRLQNRIFNLVRRAHPSQHCDFCLKMVDMLVFGANPDTLWLRLLGGERAARTLTKFVRGVVDLIASMESRQGCTGQTLIVDAVFEFLFVPAQLQASETS